VGDERPLGECARFAGGRGGRKVDGGTLEVLAVRRVRTLVVLFAMVCAVFTGSTSVVSAGGSRAASIGAATAVVPLVGGKRWDRG
jgi:hypothetical protein